MRKIINLFIIIIVVVFNISFIGADSPINIEVDYARGLALVKPYGMQEWLPLNKGIFLHQGDIIKTGNSALVDLKFDDLTFSRISENSEIQIELAEVKSHNVKKLFFSTNKKSQKINIKINNGGVLSKVGKLGEHSSFTVKTPTAVCGVRGTLFNTSFNGSTSVKVMSGMVMVTNPNLPKMQAFVMPGQTTSIKVNMPPEPPRTMSPKETAEINGLLSGIQTSLPSAGTNQNPDAGIVPAKTDSAKSSGQEQTLISTGGESAGSKKTEGTFPPAETKQSNNTNMIAGSIVNNSNSALQKSKVKLKINILNK